MTDRRLHARMTGESGKRVQAPHRVHRTVYMHTNTLPPWSRVRTQNTVPQA